MIYYFTGVTIFFIVYTLSSFIRKDVFLGKGYCTTSILYLGIFWPAVIVIHLGIHIVRFIQVTIFILDIPPLDLSKPEKSNERR